MELVEVEIAVVVGNVTVVLIVAVKNVVTGNVVVILVVVDTMSVVAPFTTRLSRLVEFVDSTWKYIVPLIVVVDVEL